MVTEPASPARLIALRDRLGLLPPDTAWQVLQRLTWIHTTPEAVSLMNRAVDDVLANPAEAGSPESNLIRCDRDRHWIIRTRKKLPCPYCEFWKETGRDPSA